MAKDDVVNPDNDPLDPNEPEPPPPPPPPDNQDDQGENDGVIIGPGKGTKPSGKDV